MPVYTIRPVKIADLPKSRVGATGKDSVAIGGNGQFRLSTTLDKKASPEFLAASWLDQKKRLYGFQVVSDVAKWTAELIKAKILPKDANGMDYLIAVKRGKEGDSSPYFAGSSLLKMELEDYDYKESGNQSFDAEYDEKTRMISFIVPVGKLDPKPSNGRGRKKGSKNAPKAVGAAADANDGATANAPVVNLEEAE
jgi:hypothetical protein